MARHSFSKRGGIKNRGHNNKVDSEGDGYANGPVSKGKKAVLRLDNKQPLGTKPLARLTEPGQDAEASDYPAQKSRVGGISHGERSRAGSSGSIGIETHGKGRSGR